MKKLWMIGILFLFLTGCSEDSQDMQRGLSLRSKLLHADGCSFLADITADYGDKLHSFSLNCQADPEGSVSFSVLSPESIADISGEISKESGKLTFEGTALYFDKMADGQISPVSAPWIFLETLRSGYLTSAGREDPFLRLTIDDRYEEDPLTLDIWLNEQDIPVHCEILYDGKRILSLAVRDFQIL